MSTSRPIIAAERMTKSYSIGPTAVHALRDVTFIIERGDFVAIMGASGSGKSTLMNIIGCLDVPTRGRYLLDGVDVRALDEGELAYVRNRKIGFVFQSFNLVPRTSALAQCRAAAALRARRQPRAPGARARGAGRGRPRRPRRATAVRALGRPAAAGRRSPARSSRTRRLILADEPTGNLDSAPTRRGARHLLRASTARAARS